MVVGHRRSVDLFQRKAAWSSDVANRSIFDQQRQPLSGIPDERCCCAVNGLAHPQAITVVNIARTGAARRKAGHLVGLVPSVSDDVAALVRASGSIAIVVEGVRVLLHLRVAAHLCVARQLMGGIVGEG